MIFFKRCPCCKKRIIAWQPKQCRHIENYKCYYCSKCKKQITPAKRVKKENHALNIIIAGIVILVFKLYDINLLEIIVFITFILFISLIYGILRGLLRHIECCDKTITRDNSKLLDNDIFFSRVDGIEMENNKNLMNFSIGLGGY